MENLPIVLRDVTRLTVVGDTGIVFEDYKFYKRGVVIHVQDEGRTLKLLPIIEGNDNEN